MSVGVGLKRNGVVYFAVDTQTSYGKLKKTQLQKERIKIQEYDNGLVIATAGTVNAIVNTRLSKIITDIEVESLTKEFIVSNIVNPLFLDHQDKGILVDRKKYMEFDLTFLLGKEDKLFYVNTDGFVIEVDKWFAIGSGQYHVFSKMETNNLEAETLLIKAVKVACDLDDGVSEPIVMYNTKEKVYKMYKDGEISEIDFN